MEETKDLEKQMAHYYKILNTLTYNSETGRDISTKL
jgi:hypothetical protein